MGTISTLLGSGSPVLVKYSAGINTAEKTFVWR